MSFLFISQRYSTRSQLCSTLNNLITIIEDLSQASLLKRITWRNVVSSRISLAYKEVDQVLQEINVCVFGYSTYKVTQTFFQLGMNIELRRYQHDNEEARKVDDKQANDKFELLLQGNKDIVSVGLLSILSTLIILSDNLCHRNCRSTAGK